MPRVLSSASMHSSATAAAPPGVLRVAVSSLQFARAGEGAISFRVDSYRSPASWSSPAAQDADERMSLGDGAGSVDARSRATSLDAASPAAQRAAQQSVWRSYADFRQLHAALAAEAAAEAAAAAGAASARRQRRRFDLALPPRQTLLQRLSCTVDDSAELLRCALDDWLKAAAAATEGASRALAAFVSEAVRPDWPDAVGAIDLERHDRPHDSSVTEWWYLNTHFRDAEGREFSAFLAVFRVVKHTDAATGARSYAHAVNWAVTDVANKRYVHESLLDRDSPAIVKKQLEGDRVIKDGRLKRAYLEILDRGNVPLPDRMFAHEPSMALDKLDFAVEGCSLSKDAAGNYLVRCATPDGRTALDLKFRPRKQAVRHGLDGVVKGHDGDDMFYYLVPRCDVTGSFVADGERRAVAEDGSASGWYDHEFGGKRASPNEVPAMEYAWNWAAIQLDNGVDLSVAKLVDPRKLEPVLDAAGAAVPDPRDPKRPLRRMVEMERRAIVIGADSQRSQPEDLLFEETPGREPWTSVRTFNSYPTSWRVAMPSAGIDLTLEASFEDQEFVTLIAKPGFWEGRVAVRGTVHGAPVRGVGFVERNGFQTLSELDGFFKLVGVETRRAVREVYPDVVDEAAAVKLIATPDTAHYIEGVDLNVFRRSIIEPVRYISDQGGKSWRSYGALACMDVVGGDSRKYVRWLSMPEFMHVGSLIVDDIQDDSLKRRGVDCAHIVFGDAIAINAGTASYFQGQQMLLVPGMTAEKLNQIYDFYFAALRAGHAGQGLDITGLGYLMDDVIARGDAALAESRIIAIHRLKTAVPAASLAKMGAVVGGGTPAQVKAVGTYYESVGIAFQIMDDVLNLRGLYSGKADKTEGSQLKTLGEDISAGKVTIPVVKAIGLLPRDEMRALWDVIKTCPHDRATVDACIATLERCGAIDACVAHASRLVESSYQELDRHIPDSFSKIMLRSFGW